MVATSFSGLLMVLLTGAGTPANDLVSWIDPADYFKSRDVFLSADKMMVLADSEPADAKEEIARLLALRWLGAHPDDARKAEKSLATLKQVAAGKKGNDPHGFAREYAQRALAVIEGKPAPAAPPLPAGSVRDEALRWFPADVTICGALDLRPSGDPKGPDAKHPKEFPPVGLAAFLPPDAKERLYQFAEAVGNLRVHRIAFALQMPARGAEPERIYLRVTGLGDRGRLAAFIGQQLRGATVTAKKGPRGEPITLAGSEDNAPAFALAGDTDVIIAGYQKNKARHLDVVEQALATRAGGQPSVLNGRLAARLKDVPEQAAGLLLGELTEDLVKEMTSHGSPFRAFPRRFAADLVRDKGLQVRVEGAFKDANEARAFVDSFEQV